MCRKRYASPLTRQKQSKNNKLHRTTKQTNTVHQWPISMLTENTNCYCAISSRCCVNTYSVLGSLHQPGNLILQARHQVCISDGRMIVSLSQISDMLSIQKRHRISTVCNFYRRPRVSKDRWLINCSCQSCNFAAPSNFRRHMASGWL